MTALLHGHTIWWIFTVEAEQERAEADGET
jgi:hypothetical protein